MTYSNPRLKHVKNIQLTIQTLLWDIERKDMDIEVTKQYIKDILDQCNLLLETKKAKKRKKVKMPTMREKNEAWKNMMFPSPDPKEESKCECSQCQIEKYGGASGNKPHTPSRSEEPNNPKTTLKEIEPLGYDISVEKRTRNATWGTVGEMSIKIDQLIEGFNQLIKSK